MVRAEQGLVCRVEGGQPPARHAGGDGALPARVGEYALDEARAQGGVVETPLVLDGEQRQPLHERAREEAGATAQGPAALAVHPDPLHAAAGRVLLEDVADEIQARELRGARPGEARHRAGQVPAAVRGHQSRSRRIALEADRLARDAEAELHLGADGHPLDEAPERLGEERVALVAAVVAHLVAEEAGADAEAERRHRQEGAPSAHAAPLSQPTVDMKLASPCARPTRPALLRRANTHIFPNHTYTEAMMATLVRKNVFLDPATLKRAQAILGRRSESEAIREALELVAFRTKVMKGYDRAAG